MRTIRTGGAVAEAELSKLSQSQRDRLAFIDLRARYLGEVGRQDVVVRFGLQVAAASRDLAQYRVLANGNLKYDGKEKLYRSTASFRPLFDFPIRRVLTWLRDGVGDEEPSREKAPLVHEVAALPISINHETLSVLTRAIHQRAAVQIYYAMLESGLTAREVAPFALGSDGLRWHVRAFDRRTGRFGDFVLGRIADAQLLPGAVADHERPSHDIQWNRVAELVLVPHPANVQHPDVIEGEYGMQGGELRIQVRAAMTGHLLFRWNVDCTEDHRLKGAEYHLWLRNRQALYGIENLELAPGFGGAGSNE
jgi:hypothetical protein